MKTTRDLALGTELEYRPSHDSPMVYFATVVDSDWKYLTVHYHDEEEEESTWSYDHDEDAHCMTLAKPNPYDLDLI